MNHPLTTFLLFMLVLCLHTKPLAATQRELGSEGNIVRLSIDATYQCSDEAEIRIDAGLVSYFDTGAEVIQNLSDNARAVLGFECASIQKIYYKGFTNEIEVFSADTSAEVGWVLQSAPAPLERFALFFSLRQPNLLNLGTLYALRASYEELPGLEDSYQYEFYKNQLRRLAGTADVESFATYVEDPGIDLGTFNNAKAHFEAILEAIEEFRPELADGYSLEYFTRLASLKDSYWSAQVSSILDDYSLSFTDILQQAQAVVVETDSAEFTAYFDQQIAEAFQEEIEFIETELPEASLSDVSFAADFLVGLPEEDYSDTFPVSATVVKLLPGQMVPEVEARRVALIELAKEAIFVSGETYFDVDPIIESGFALADEFEEAGYLGEAENILSYTVERVGQVLQDDLSRFQQELASLELDDESATALQEQALVFRELGEQFSDFTEYVRAIENKLVSDRNSICESILAKAGVDTALYSHSIAFAEGRVTLNDLTCALYDNSHVLTGLEEVDGAYQLSVYRADEKTGQYALSEIAGVERVFSVVSKNEGENATNDPAVAENDLYRLIEPPPNGMPDADGIRECDRLAADPYDSGKLSSGLDFENVDIEPDAFDRAFDACIAAVEDDPMDARQQFQLGRMLWYAGDMDAAGEYFDSAAELDYGPAWHFKAELLLNSSDNQNDFVDALDWFEAAGNAGYKPGAEMIAELNPDGAEFYKEIPPPTGKEILGALPQTSAGGSMMGVTSSFRIVDVSVKSCFQTSATNFSCEFRKIMKCGMSGGFGGDRGSALIMQLFSRAAQSDCDNIPFEFGDFRKRENGSWQQLSG